MPLFGVAVIAVELPLQIVGLVADALAVNWSTVTVVVAVALQLLASVIVTVYVVVEAGVAVGLCTVEELMLADGLQL